MSEDRTGALRSTPRTRELLAFWEGGSVRVALPAKGTVVLGRSSGCDVVLDDASISRRHAALHVDASLRLEDLGSSNGTKVDGRRLGPGELVELRRGAAIGLGEVTIVLEHGDASESLEDAATSWRELLDRVADSTLPIILVGETGVGKEVAAQSIHEASRRVKEPLIKLNCAAVPEPLLESELFGYEAGAFTGARTAKPGMIEAAHRGTLFLDELGEMPLTTQAKLLRALESGEIVRLGSVKPRTIDVRFVAASNRDLEAMVAEGTFRRDLYFRLNGVVVHIPPLRERVREIATLASRFVTLAAARAERPPPRIHPDVLALLEGYAWPGNIRELKNTMERALVLCSGDTIRPEHLAIQTSGPASAAASASTATVPPPPPSAHPLPTEVATFERERILAVLERCHGNQTRAAAELGISRRTLVYRLASWGLTKPRRREPDDG